MPSASIVGKARFADVSVSGTTPSVTWTVPQGTAIGDMVVVTQNNFAGGTASVNVVPNGWTLIGNKFNSSQQISSGSAGGFNTFYTIASSSTLGASWTSVVASPGYLFHHVLDVVTIRNSSPSNIFIADSWSALPPGGPSTVWSSFSGSQRTFSIPTLPISALDVGIINLFATNVNAGYSASGTDYDPVFSSNVSEYTVDGLYLNVASAKKLTSSTASLTVPSPISTGAQNARFIKIAGNVNNTYTASVRGFSTGFNGQYNSAGYPYSTNSVSVTIPASTKTGDTLIAVVNSTLDEFVTSASGIANFDIIAPSGWKRIGRLDQSSTQQSGVSPNYSAVFAKNSMGESGSIVFTSSGNFSPPAISVILLNCTPLDINSYQSSSYNITSGPSWLPYTINSKTYAVDSLRITTALSTDVWYYTYPFGEASPFTFSNSEIAITSKSYGGILTADLSGGGGSYYSYGWGHVYGVAYSRFNNDYQSTGSTTLDGGLNGYGGLIFDFLFSASTSGSTTPPAVVAKRKRGPGIVRIGN